MLTFATPWVLIAGALASAGIVTLHFLSVQRPPVLLLPTTRFLDEGATRAVSRSARPSDVVLLLLRVAALVLSCLALAGPRWMSASATTRQLVVADVALRKDSAALAQSFGAAQNGATQFVWMDSADGESLTAGLRATLTSALPVAIRAAAAAVAEHPEVDSLRLQIAMVRGTPIDVDGWRAWRTAWPGAVRVLARDAFGAASVTDDSLRAAALSAVPKVVFEQTTADDPVRAAFAIRAATIGTTSRLDWPMQRVVRVVRGSGDVLRETPAMTRAPSASSAMAVPDARSNSRRETSSSSTSNSTSSVILSATSTEQSVDVVTVRWPSSGAPDGWDAAHDTSGALATRGVALVGTWLRTSGVRVASLHGARPIVWWADGNVAATERATPGGCTRDVGILIPPSNERLLDPDADALLQALASPCAGARGSSTVLPAFIRDDSLDRSRGAAAPAAAFLGKGASNETAVPAWMTPLLLALAIIVLLVEWTLRIRFQRAAADAAARERQAVTIAGLRA